MSKTASANLKATLASEEMTTATCLLLERTRFTPRIVAITQAANGVVETEIAHGLTTGDQVVIRGGDMVEIDDTTITVTVTDATHYETGINTTGYTAYTGGATSNPLLGFTDHDSPITYQGVTFQGDLGYTPSAVVNSGDLAVDNLDLYGLLDSLALEEQDILAGRYDYARLHLFLLDYESLADGHMSLKYGRIGEVSLQRDLYTAEFRGLAQSLDQDTIEHYMPSCWATLGNAKCGIDLTDPAHNTTGTISGLISQRQFEDTSLTGATGTWRGGILRWLTGNNAGREVEVVKHIQNDPDHGNNTTVQLIEGEFGTLQIGDTYAITRGCDKSLATCRDVFANTVNFRGYPHLPGLAEMLNYGNRTAEVD